MLYDDNVTEDGSKDDLYLEKV